MAANWGKPKGYEVRSHTSGNVGEVTLQSGDASAKVVGECSKPGEVGLVKSRQNFIS